MSRRSALVIALALFSAACIDSLEPDVGEPVAGSCENGDSDEDKSVSFQSDLLPKFQTGCGCHSPVPPGTGAAIDSTGFSVGDYTSLRRGGQSSRDKIIVPGDPCNSFLYQKLSAAPPTGARMPIYGPYWSSTDLQVLHDWIAEGARAN